MIQIFKVLFVAYMMAIAPCISQSHTLGEEIYLKGRISDACWEGPESFMDFSPCTPMDVFIKTHSATLIQAYDAKYRMKRYLEVSRNAPTNILMALCESHEAVGISEEMDCAQRWNSIFRDEVHGDDWEGFLTVRLGKDAGAQIVNRAYDLADMYFTRTSESKIPPTEPASPSTAIAIPVSSDGHYYLSFFANGVSVSAVVDTGAGSLILTKQTAIDVGIDMSSLTYDQPFSTANGSAYFAKVNL